MVLLPLQGLLRDSQLLPQRVQLVRLSNTNSCCHLRPESVMFHVCVRELAFGSQLLWCLLGQPAACLLAQVLVSRNSGHFLKTAHQQTNKDILLANGVGCVSLSLTMLEMCYVIRTKSLQVSFCTPFVCLLRGSPQD